MSAAPDMGLLAELRAEGLRLSLLAGGNVNVAPRERVTPEVVARVRAHKPALLAALAAEQEAACELARRIRVMAVRWQYDPEDLAWALEAAQRDPGGWLVAVRHDEELHRRLGRIGLAT
ncbi:MAG: hypothetical protein QM696_08675 [Steroidobacteraceae bacterium]